MTEDEARSWIASKVDVPRVKVLERFARILIESTSKQNLVSAASIETLWSRHIADSVQLLDHGPACGRWIDIGSGAGLPGIAIAICADCPLTLIEPRRLRVEFLRHVTAELGLEDRVAIVPDRCERHHSSAPAAVISARAVAPLIGLLAAAEHLANRDTIWILPKGRHAHSEVAAARLAWQGAFHVKPSVTEPTSGIVVAQGVHRR